MDDEHLDHVVEAFHDLAHDDADDLRLHFEVLDRHQLLQICTVAVVHKHIVATVCLYSLTHANTVLAIDRVLVLDLTDDQQLVALA